MSNFLPPEGNKNSPIAFIIDSPQAKDIYDGGYFSGYVGTMFAAILGSSGLSRQNTYTTSLVKNAMTPHQYTQALKAFNIYTQTQEYKAWKEYLRRELLRTEANVLVPMGELSFYALTGKRMHNKFRGSILQCTLVPGRKIIGCYHPSVLLSQYHLQPILRCDLNKIVKQSKDRIIELESSQFIIEPDYSFAMDVMQSIIQEASIISWDIETAGQAISCIGFSTDKHDGICIPLTIPGQRRYWPTHQEREILRAIQKVLQSGIPNGGQNINYDLCWMIKTLSIVPFNTSWDTMIASHSCYSELPKDLGTLTSLYTNYPYYKDEGNVWRAGVKADKYMTQQEKLHQYWKYNIKDCHRTLAIWRALEKEMDDLNVRCVHDFIVKKYLPQAVYMTVHGVDYDTQKQAQWHQEYEQSIKELSTSMIETYHLPENFNLNSPAQLKDLFYNLWGMKEKRNRSTGTITVDDVALRSLKREYPKYAPFITQLQDYRSQRKLMTTYLGLETYDDKIHFGYNVVGTETGRWSSSKSCFGDGTNGQNIPDSIRRMVTAPSGYVFINADLSQAEARIVAMLGAEMALLQLFESGQDVHSLNAQRIFNIQPDEVHDIFSGTKTYRDIGKRVVHASNYNMKARTFAIQTGIKIADATKALQLYFNMYPGIPRYHRWVENEIRNKRMLTTIFGRKRMFFGRLDTSTMREAYAMIPQSTVGDILNHGAYEIFIKIPHTQHILQVHDSIMVLCPEDKVIPTCKEMRSLMEIPITINNITHTIPVDFSVGKNWGHKTVGNPEGLDDVQI